MGGILEKFSKSRVFGGENGGRFNSVRHDFCSLINSYSVWVSFVDSIAMLCCWRVIIAQHKARRQFVVNQPLSLISEVFGGLYGLAVLPGQPFP